MRRASCGACRFRRRDRHPIRLADAGRQGPRSGRDGGTSVAMVPPDSVGGSLLPLAGLAAEGVKIAKDAPFLTHANSAAAAETMLVDGEADAIFGWMPAVADGQPDVAGGTVARLEMAGLSKAALQVVWTSGLLRYGPYAVRSDLDPEAKRRLTVFSHQSQIDVAGCLRSSGIETFRRLRRRWPEGLRDGCSHRAPGVRQRPIAMAAGVGRGRFSRCCRESSGSCGA